jgi:hypothetical protein
MVQYLKHDVSETESVSVFKREAGEPTLVGYKELLNHRTTKSKQLSVCVGGQFYQ